MVYTITKENIDTLKNEGLKTDAKKYIEQYENFLEYIKESGAAISGKDYSKKEQELLKKLEEKVQKYAIVAKVLLLMQYLPHVNTAILVLALQLIFLH